MSQIPPYNSTTELIAQCEKGNNEAFKILYKDYNKAMYNICFRMLNNKEESEDVLQESFISAFQNIKQFDGIVSFGSWLKRIVINRCIDALRKRNVNLIPIEEKDLPEELPEEVHINYTIENVKNALTELPDGYRIILTLYLFEEYSHRMIADKLGISEGTSKSQYARAKKKLIQCIIKKNRNHER